MGCASSHVSSGAFHVLRMLDKASQLFLMLVRHSFHSSFGNRFRQTSPKRSAYSAPEKVSCCMDASGTRRYESAPEMLHVHDERPRDRAAIHQGCQPPRGNRLAMVRPKQSSVD